MYRYRAKVIGEPTMWALYFIRQHDRKTIPKKEDNNTVCVIHNILFWTRFRVR